MGNAIKDKSFAFSVRIVKLCRYVRKEKREYEMANQLLRSGISVGANVREAEQGESKKDFIHKMNIALKEANESLYWIELMSATDILPEEFKNSIWKDCNELISLLVSIIKTAKKKIEN